MLTVAVGDDHPVVRAGLVQMLAAASGVSVVAEADDGEALLAAVRELRPRVVLTDFRMPVLDGAAVAAQVALERLPSRVLLLSAFTDPGIVLRCVESGAAGFLSKDCDRSTLLRAVHDVAAGRDFLPGGLVPELLDEVRRRRSAAPAVALSGRERQILESVAAGRSAPSIAAETYLSLSTVKTYLQRIYDKLGVSDRGAAVAEAMRRGILQ
ncbi:response regulator transcription factor [Nocardioides zeae]|uniref:Response regulator transcription factor n=1 Tax=Nocardioides imazamoxiresistens TaxID=3231893 RepID=A0ABU3PVJ3_9ACTN|nr:response regulator transcription factor [Nocardioides zeae]MDT9593240.1 response regulator transcription factor [Nocardioides zeae]